MKNKVATFVGAFVMVVLIIGGVLGCLYWLTLQFEGDTLRWVTVACILSLPVSVVITWRVATNSAREHLRGFERGLDGAEKTITSVVRGLSVTASMARVARGTAAPVQSNDDLLPRVGTMRILDAGCDDGDLVDL